MYATHSDISVAVRHRTRHEDAAAHTKKRGETIRDGLNMR